MHPFICMFLIFAPNRSVLSKCCCFCVVLLSKGGDFQVCWLLGEDSLEVDGDDIVDLSDPQSDN